MVFSFVFDFLKNYFVSSLFLFSKKKNQSLQTIDQRVISIEERVAGAVLLQRWSGKRGIVGGNMNLSPEDQVS